MANEEKKRYILNESGVRFVELEVERWSNGLCKSALIVVKQELSQDNEISLHPGEIKELIEVFKTKEDVGE